MLLSSLRASSSSSLGPSSSSSSSTSRLPRTLVAHLLASTSSPSYPSSRSYTSSSSSSHGSIAGPSRNLRPGFQPGQAQIGRVTTGRRSSSLGASPSIFWTSTSRTGRVEELSSHRQFSHSLSQSLRSSVPSLFPHPPPSSPPTYHDDEDPNDPLNIPYHLYVPAIPPFKPSPSDPTTANLVPPSLLPTPTAYTPTPEPSAPQPLPKRVYTPGEAAKSLSELKSRLDRLIEASEGDLDVAENALERLASELGREKDKAVNETGSGKRKPSFAPDSALGAREVQELMDGWELELERAIVLAMHPRSQRFCHTTREYLTKTIHGIFILSPARVASLITRTTMALLLQRTSPLATQSASRSDAPPSWDLDPRNKHATTIGQALRNEEVDNVNEQKAVDATFELYTSTLAQAYSEQLSMEYFYAQGALKFEHDAGVRLNKYSVGKILKAGSEVMNEREELAKNLSVKEETLPVGRSPADDIILGTELISLVLDVWSLRSIGSSERPFKHQSQIKVDNHRPEFYKLLHPNPDLVQLLVRAAPDARFMVRDLPMIAPPRLWPTKSNGLHPSSIGGYHVRKTTIVKKMGRPDRKQLIHDAMHAGDMDGVLEAVNIISANKWNVRSPVLDVILQSVNPDRFIEDVASTKKDQFTAIRNLVKETHLLPLNIARAFEGRDFYLPHNLDYRGRIYSLSPYLHPCGDDFSRGLLTFGDKKKLGKDGLWWLKIHLAGVYGEDKKSFEDRVAWVDARMDQVLASSKDPIHNDWWIRGDKAFQTLAACLEVSDAVNSPNHEEFESSLPVHMDGTCNGLQYYAALGRDVKGGKSVNLSPSDLPQDVYGEVLEIVRETVASDKDGKWDLLREHKWLLARKTVKPTVMTSVYGVTQMGARLQVQAALEDLVKAEKEKGGNVTDLENTSTMQTLSSELATLILSSINKLFPVATSIQEWLGTCLWLVVHAGSEHRDSTDQAGNSMQWTSPLGLPIVQAYREIRTKIVKTRLQAVTIVNEDLKGNVMTEKEKNGFAPNFVHSLDATHLFMTAKACHAQGVTFGSVHDSFWTHAATVPVLNATLREEFVRLHSSEPPLLERLRNQLLDRFGEEYISPEDINTARTDWKKSLKKRREAGVDDDPTTPWPRWASEETPSIEGDPARARIQLKHVLPPVPSTGELDIEDVKKSRYFFK